LSQVKKDWFAIAEKFHKLYGGKIEISFRVPITKFDDFSIWYTPGVAEPCRRIHQGGEDLSFEYTWRWNAAAVISDGTRILGLGDIGPAAGLPVMEGKALLFKYLGGVEAFPIVVREKNPDKFIYIVKALEPSFGAVNLEDIGSPKCFYILEKLQQILDIPVWHDDQQGTALVTIAALINALKLTGRKFEHTRFVLFGAGAANVCTYRYLKVFGAKPENMIAIDSKGVLHRERPDLEEMKKENHWKYQIAKVIVVHGGGDEVTEMCKKLGIEPKFVISPEGIRSRYTDRDELEVYVMVMAGKINKLIVTKLNMLGVKAVGISGADGPTLIAERKKRIVIVDERGRKRVIGGGCTGRITYVEVRLLQILLDSGYIVVVAPIAINLSEGTMLNVDGDQVAYAIAITTLTEPPPPGRTGLADLSSLPTGTPPISRSPPYRSWSGPVPPLRTSRRGSPQRGTRSPHPP
jgi:malate dehydrogenase (oxaloacetate-decarboxylating)